MKHSLFSVVLGIALVAGAAVANAQTYVYPLTSGVPLPSACVSFTAYQTFGSSDITTSGQVSELQVLLNREGYLSGVSGTYDNGTYGAVINYQRAHGIQITGTVGPITAAALSQDGCQGSYGNTGYGYTNPVVNQVSNCSWINGAYQCGYNNSNYNSNYNNYYSNNNNNCGYNNNTPSSYYANNWYQNNGCNQYNQLRIASISASYGYNQTTLTLTGTGFSSTGNTVYFNNTAVTNVTSYNGDTLTFVVPSGYYSGSYPVSVTNTSGISSNSLTFVINNSNGYYNNNNYNNGNGYYNNGNNNNCYENTSYNNNSNYYYNGNTNYNNNNCQSTTLSAITGPTSVQTGTTNTWNISVNNSGSQNATITTNWGDASTSNGQSAYLNGGNSYQLTHVYNTPGTYTIRTTASTNSGYSTSSTLVVTVHGTGNYGYNYNYQYQY